MFGVASKYMMAPGFSQMQNRKELITGSGVIQVITTSLDKNALYRGKASPNILTVIKETAIIVP